MMAHKNRNEIYTPNCEEEKYKLPSFCCDETKTKERESMNPIQTFILKPS